MKKIIIGVLILLVAAGIFLLVQTLHQSTAPVPVNPGGISTFPIGNNATATPRAQIKMSLPNGTVAVMNDFIHNNETIPDTVNPGMYVLAGSLGYCLSDGSCPTGAIVEGFTINYDDKHKLFNILLEEPLNVNRIKAEQFLAGRLDLKPEVMCALQYWIGTTSYINSNYAGKNLLFSFCPGSVKL